MSNSPMCGIAGYPAGAWCMDMDMDGAEIEIQRKRDALRAKLALLLEARRRLDEIIEYDAGGGQLVDGAGGAASADESSDTAGDDDFYPLDDNNDDEPEECPMQWQDQVCRQIVDDNNSRHLQQDDDDDDLVGHLAYSDNNDIDYLDDNDNGDGDGDEISRDIVALGLQVPHIHQAACTATSPPFVMPREPADDSGGGFGAVLASTAATAGLKKQPGAWSMDMDMDMDGAEIQRKSDALRSKLAVLLEARRRLDKIIEHDAGGAAEDESADTGGDDFYPLDYNDEPEERPMQWQDQMCRQMVYNSSRHLQQGDDHDLAGHLADSDNHDLDYFDDNEGDGDEISRDIVALGLHVPHIQQTGEEAADDGDGFGAVPASAAAIAGLRKHRYDGSGRDSMCVICMRSYTKGRRLRVMPCTHKHRFHGRCIREWLSRSNLCPLCRHALPTADAEEQGGGGGVRRSTIVRVNVNPY